MTARADATEETGHRILDAFTQLFIERPFAQITLREVAARAGVSVQTVIRRFTDKDGLSAAAAARETARVAVHRGAVVPGDLDGIVDNLLDHYDTDGRIALRLLAEEDATPAIAPVTARARGLHHEWCEEVFAPFLAGLTVSGLAGSVMELAAGRRLSFGEPFVSSRNVVRSLGSAAAAGPFMLVNDALKGWRGGAVSTMVLISCALTSLVWLLATGIVAIDLASRAACLLS